MAVINPERASRSDRSPGCTRSRYRQSTRSADVLRRQRRHQEQPRRALRRRRGTHDQARGQEDRDPAEHAPERRPSTGLVYLTSFKTGEIGVLDPTTLTVGKRIQTNSTPVTWPSIRVAAWVIRRTCSPSQSPSSTSIARRCSRRFGPRRTKHPGRRRSHRHRVLHPVPEPRPIVLTAAR